MFSAVSVFGMLLLTMPCAKCDVHANMLNLVYVPGLCLDLSPLHDARPMCSVTLNTDGAHMLDGSLSLLRHTWRRTTDPIAAALLVSGKCSAWILKTSMLPSLIPMLVL